MDVKNKLETTHLNIQNFSQNTEEVIRKLTYQILNAVPQRYMYRKSIRFHIFSLVYEEISQKLFYKSTN